MRALILVPAFFLASCATPCLPAAGATTTAFSCDDGSGLIVTFGPASAELAQEGYTLLILPARMTGSGYRYAEGGVELRGRGAEVRLSRPGAAETICRGTR